jgi:hypothetical protein
MTSHGVSPPIPILSWHTKANEPLQFLHKNPSRLGIGNRNDLWTREATVWNRNDSIVSMNPNGKFLL